MSEKQPKRVSEMTTDELAEYDKLPIDESHMEAARADVVDYLAEDPVLLTYHGRPGTVNGVPVFVVDRTPQNEEEAEAKARVEAEEGEANPDIKDPVYTLYESKEALERGDLLLGASFGPGNPRGAHVQYRLPVRGSKKTYLPAEALVVEDVPLQKAVLSVFGYRRHRQGSGIMGVIFGWPAWCGHCVPDRALIKAWEEYKAKVN